MLLNFGYSLQKYISFVKNFFRLRKIFISHAKILLAICLKINYYLPMNRKKLLTKLRKEAKKQTYQELSKKIGVYYVTLWRVMNGKSEGSIAFWEKIIKYFSKRA